MGQQQPSPIKEQELVLLHREANQVVSLKASSLQDPCHSCPKNAPKRALLGNDQKISTTRPLQKLENFQNMKTTMTFSWKNYSTPTDDGLKGRCPSFACTQGRKAYPTASVSSIHYICS